MKPLPGVLILLTAALATGAESKIDLMQNMTARMEVVRELKGEIDAADQAVIDLVGTLPPPAENPDISMPERSETDSVAVADGGLLFDANNFRLVYINNVRVADRRLEMRCSDKLYIQFTRESISKGKNSAQGAIISQPGSRAESAPISAPVAPAPKARPTTTIPAATPPAPRAAAKPTKPQLPLCVTAANALVDASRNITFLEGAATGSTDLLLTRGEDEVRLSTADGSTAAILADSNGDIFMTSGSIDIKWKDAKGHPCSLHNDEGVAYYRAETRELYLQGPTTIITADGTLTSTRHITIALNITEDPGAKSSFMPQFSGLRVEGIRNFTAEGDVKLTRPANGSSPASEVLGDIITYDGQTGEVTASGKTTSFIYGEQRITTNGSLHLAGNGDITLLGETIEGVYTRPAGGTDGSPLTGTFHTSGTITYTAATHIIAFPNGLSASDPLSNINIGGRVELLMQEAADRKVPTRENVGMLNLAIARYDDIATVHAMGGISLTHRDSPDEQGLTMIGDEATLDFRNAEATLTAAPGKSATLRYNGHMLAATSAGSVSSLYLAPNGDLTMKGDSLHAVIPGKKKPSTATCTDHLILLRESGSLKLGPSCKVSAEEGILTANSELTLTLYPGPAEKNVPILPRYPHLIFNYAGLHTADTAKGGTVQTAKGSMQCSGPIHVDMSPEGDSDSPLSSVRRITASGNVAIAGRDSGGRLLRATGDHLLITGANGMKILSGSQVILQDANSTHIASGKGARIEVDGKNNIRIKGARQSTRATRIKDQIDKNKKKKKK